MLKNALLNFLELRPSDTDILDLFKTVRTKQTNGIQLSYAILQSCKSQEPKEHIRIHANMLHADNAQAYLAIRYRNKLQQYREEGYGYRTIAKMLAQRGAYNKKTGKAYSHITIKKALALLEKKNELS